MDTIPVLPEDQLLLEQIDRLSLRLEDKDAELSLLRQMGEALAKVDDFRAALRVSVDVVIRNTAARNFSVMLVDEQRQQLFLIAASDPENKRFIADVEDVLGRRNLRYSFRHGEGVAGQVCKGGVPIVVSDTTASPFFSVNGADSVEVGSLVSVPMTCQGKVIGVINASHPASDCFDQHDIPVFCILADFIALLVSTSLSHARLQLSEEKYRTLAENSNDGIAVIRQGRHLYANPRYQDLTGYSEEELREIPFDQVLRPQESGQPLYHGLCYHSGSIARLLKGILCGRNGRQVEIEASTAPFGYDQDDAFLVSVRDLSYRRHLERQIRQFQKMEAIGTLASGVAHDFNNVLAAMIGYTELALRRLPGDHPVREYLKQVTVAGDRARNVVRQILTFSRQTEQEKRLVCIGPIIKETMHLLRSTTPQQIEIRTDIQPDCYVEADPTAIHQVVMNLCINAVQAIHAEGSGEIHISLKKTTTGEPGAPPMVCLAVRDTGQGMTASVRERIFEPYFTTKDLGVGTGLGLSVVHGIVQNLGGMVRVETESGSGACFEVFLPAAKFAGTSAQVSEESRDAMQGKGRILLVDDEESLVRMGRELLIDMGYMVTGANSSEEALQLFSEDQDAFDLVITDHGMPGIKGIDLAERLHRLRPQMPIILCTGYCDVLQDGNAKPVGIGLVLRKPVMAKELVTAIRRMMGQDEE